LQRGGFWADNLTSHTLPLRVLVPAFSQTALAGAPDELAGGGEAAAAHPQQGAPASRVPSWTLRCDAPTNIVCVLPPQRHCRAGTGGLPLLSPCVGARLALKGPLHPLPSTPPPTSRGANPPAAHDVYVRQGGLKVRPRRRARRGSPPPPPAWPRRRDRAPLPSSRAYRARGPQASPLPCACLLRPLVLLKIMQVCESGSGWADSLEKALDALDRKLTKVRSCGSTLEGLGAHAQRRFVALAPPGRRCGALGGGLRGRDRRPLAECLKGGGMLGGGVSALPCLVWE
jgi:hypothetical protein